tara:strand:- start:3901 stop:4296 length:396 start_codon:yes stop_codon:yes gene_type:complete
MPARQGNNGGGRRSSPFDLEKVESLASKGLNNNQIGAALGISERRFYTAKKHQKDFKAAIEKGRCKGIALVADALVRNAVHGGNVTAQIFFLKCHAGWRDNTTEGIETGTVSNPLIIKLSGNGSPSNDAAE